MLNWLRSELEGEVEISKPDYEDWGWYSEILWNGRQYMLGVSTYCDEGEDPHSELEWVFQIKKKRTFKEMLFRMEKNSKTDSCVEFFKNKLESEAGINFVDFV